MRQACLATHLSQAHCRLPCRFTCWLAGEQDNGQQDSHPAGNIQHSEQTPGNGSESDTVNASDSDSSGPTEPPNPQAVLTGRTAGGFALEFNPQKQALLLGGDLAGGVQLWDVAAASSSGGSSSGSSSAAQRIKPLQVGLTLLTQQHVQWLVIA